MTFSTTATAGRNALGGLELERRHLEHGHVERLADERERGRADVARHRRAQARRAQQISVTSAVVVDFPFVPVTATIGTASAAPASSMSPHTRAARER